MLKASAISAIILLLGLQAPTAELGFTEFYNGELQATGEFPLSEVIPGSEAHKLIEKAISEIYRSPLKETMCELYSTPLFFSHALGVSFSLARDLISTCKNTTQPSNSPPKAFAKKYYLSLDSDANLPIQSWTTGNNRTIIYADNKLDFLGLKNILLHEIAIAHDAKMNMMYTTFEAYFRSQPFYYVFFTPANLDEKNEHLQKAFNASTYHPLAFTFATMRAFNVEALANGHEQDTALSHDKCVATFLELLPMHLKNIDSLKADDNTFAGRLASVVSSSNEPQNLTQTLDDLLNADFKVPTSKGETFCQFMATPALTGKSHMSFFGSGPRPRIGGWRQSEEKSTSEQKLFHETLLKDFKPQ